MTVPVWPAELPRPMREGYSQTLQGGVVVAKRDHGPPHVRLRSSAAVEDVALTVDLSTDERQRFRRFWDEEAKRGAVPILIPDPTLTGHELADESGAVLTDEAGNPITIDAWWLVLGGDQRPVETPIGVRWRIAMNVMVLP